ncbi:Transmembrane 7 superfamily member 3 [Rhizoctonia solani]|uniref:Transmembrane 7 superfamily member 3 n=1 Tax=Rhizoctonia solani TaxID=456999 RepID=A0A0K6G575_9AGAM|nr:Transmembrane 7 superfamily member 3 [Rhizoctonia solani]
MYLRLRTLAVAGIAAFALPSVIAQGTSSGASQTSLANTNTNSVSSTNSNASPSATVTFTDVSTVIPVLTTQSVSGTVSTVRTLSSLASVVTVTRVTLTPSSTLASATSAAASATSTPFPHLDTRVDPTFGVLGALLILTGLPTAFWGHKNRWSSFFLIGFYTLALTTIVLILKFGVLDAINPPSKAVRGMFLLASAVAGVMGGGLSIFFWKHTKYFIGAWGGFALALWIQCFREGGLIRQIAYRWIFYVGCAVVGFILCTIPKIHYNILLLSTALVGASATILGVDCYTTAGLKEFYVWNLGFMRLFPVFYNIGMPYPLYQAMQIELGLIAAVALMGGAVQFRMLGLLKRRLREINEEQRKRDEDAEIAAADRLGAFDDQLEEWEKRHGNLVGKDVSSSGGLTPTATAHDGRPSSQFSLLNGPKSAGLASTPGAKSGDYFAIPLQSPKTATIATPEQPSANGISGRPQSIGALPALDLGTDDLAGGAGGVKRDSIARMEDVIKPAEDTAAARRREELRAEIDALKKNIAQLKTETGGTTSRPASVLLLDTDPGRNRTISFNTLGSQPRSAPLEPPPESEWDKYVRERKLFTPPSGVTAPIPSGTINGRPMSMMLPDAVADAVDMRKRRESMLEMGKLEEAVAIAAIPSRHTRSRTMSGGAQLDLSGGSSSDGQRGRDRPTHTRQHSHGPPAILPPRKSMSPGPRPADSAGRPRVKTYEEMQERHREKMRALQEPLHRAEAELAELENAKSRWERSIQVERQVMERREAERRAAYERKHAEESGKSGKGGVGNRISKLFGAEKAQPQPVPALESESVEEEKTRPPRETRAGPGHLTRDSATAKVAAWQAYQEQVANDAARASGDRRVSGDGHRRQHSRQSSGPFATHARRSSGHMQSHDAPN